MEIAFAPQFKRMFKKLEEDLQQEALAKIELLREPRNNESLKVHKLKGPLKGCWSFSVNYRVRIIFTYTEPSEIVLMAIGDHDIYN